MKYRLLCVIFVDYIPADESFLMDLAQGQGMLSVSREIAYALSYGYWYVMSKGNKPMNNKPAGGAQTLSRKSLSDFQKTLEDRYSFHKEKAERHVKIFKPMGFVFGLSIPILAALVTFSMSTESGIPQPVSAVMGLALTLLTIVNSVLKPDERFAKGAQNCIALNEWKLQFDINTAEADTTDETTFHAMIQEMDKKLSEIGKAMAESWIPKPTT